MKKMLFSLVALAALLLAGSCQKENFGSANGNTVAYTVQLPGNIATKAIGDDVSSVTKLVYAVYRTEAQTADDYLAAETCLYQKTATLTNGQATLYLEFVNNQNFRVLFWAQDPNAGIYDASDLKNVTIDYTNLDANQESYAAFAGSDFIKPGDNLSGRTVYLHRAVAQLNIATTPESMVLGEAGANETSSYQTPVTLTSTQVTVNGLASTYNVADASVGDILTADFVFDATDPSVLSEQTLTVKGIDYKYISMNYVGFAPAVGTDVEVDYVIETNVGTIPNSISSVPVKPNYRTNIIGNLITSTSDYTVIIEEEWGGADYIYPTDTNSAQVALDYAEVGSTIQLQSGVNYGTLLVRPVLGSDHTVSGDWITSNYATELARTIENVTILGAEGATVDAIVFDAGYKGSNYIEGAPDLMNYINIKNLVIDGVEFTGTSDKPIFVSLQNTNLDGLTVKNCTLNCTTPTSRSFSGNSNAQLVYVYGSQGNHTFTTASKNIVITKNTVEGVLRLCELRETHNVTITDNIINNTAEHAILLASNSGKSYSGNVTVTGNSANCIRERFVRMSGAGDAVVEIKNNTVNNYLGEDMDYIKVTDGTNVTLENNTLGAATAQELATLVNKATKDIAVTLTADIEGNITLIQKEGVKVTIDGTDHKYDGVIKVHSNSNHYADAALTFKNVNFETSTIYYNEKNEPYFNFIEALENGSERYSTNITAENCTFTATGDAINIAVGLQIKSSKWAQVLNCTATDMHSLIQAQSCDETVLVSGCTINGKNGVAFKQVKAATVENCTIKANGAGEDVGYGIRFDGNTNNYGIVLKNNTVEAVQPFIVRKMTGANNTITLEGENTLKTSAEYQIVITNGSDDQKYVKPTGTYDLLGAEAFSVYEGKPVARVGSTEYDNMSEAITNWTNNTTLTLMADVTLKDVVTLKSTEHHTLDLGTYTMTAASKKHAIEITCNGRSSASYALTVNADATNPGSITATGKSCIYYSKSDSTKDRPIIRIYNGVFNGSYSINSKSNGNTNCPQIWIYGGTFNANVNLTKNMLRVFGGTFHGWINCTGDTSAYREISGGRFKSWQFMTADAPKKFGVGTRNSDETFTYNVGLYVDDEGYLVVGGPVITDFGDKFAARATNYSKWSSYLKYSSAAEQGLYYTNADLAISKHGAENVTLK